MSRGCPAQRLFGITILIGHVNMTDQDGSQYLVLAVEKPTRTRSYLAGAKASRLRSTLRPNTRSMARTICWSWLVQKVKASPL